MKTACRQFAATLPAVVAITLTGLVTAPAIAIAAPPKVPAGKWAIEYQEETCTLSRDGVDGGVGLAVRTRPLGTLAEVMVYRHQLVSRDEQFRARIDLGDGRPPIERPAVAERGGVKKAGFVKVEVTRPELERIARASTIVVSGSSQPPRHAALAPTAKALAALHECEVHLVGRWGITPAEMALWATPAQPLGDLRSLFWSDRMSDVGVLRSGGIRGVLDIDAAGEITGCRIVEESRISWVNARFCPTIRAGARFVPARNVAGEAVPGKVVTPRITSVRLR